MMLRQHIDRKKGQWGLSGVETLHFYAEAEFQKISQVAWGALPEIRKRGVQAAQDAEVHKSIHFHIF
jgi:hypothetical protein